MSVRELRRGAVAVGSEREQVLQELSTALFASLPRRDQRRKGEQYVRGLLAAQGRRSIRNVAVCLGDPTLEQSLHHFICNSTWDWMPVREALADWLRQAIGPQAWVVRQMSIPKSGRHSVGVGRGLDLHRDQPFHGQQAFGVWAASEQASSPVNWRLLLEEAQGETQEECAAAAALDFSRLYDASRRPVVLDTPTRDPESVIRRFNDAGVPVLVRVQGTAQLTVREAALPGYGQGAHSAQRIADSVRGLRRPTGWLDPTAPSGVRHVPAAKVRVGLPGREEGLARGLVLVGEWESPRRPATRLWLTNMAEVPASALLRLAKLTDRVGQDLSGFGDRAGLRDFEGRSLRGWHCHITLASAAHAVEVLTASRRDGERYFPGIPA
ncbi:MULTISPECIES: IS701 family transposase [Streptomyces]|nr:MULTISPECIES: transposase [Streptomyces]MCM9080624.1 transposase [Streptomyces spororaveus]MCX5304947.1 transposase [Streptomyces sp. NBC_00160]